MRLITLLSITLIFCTNSFSQTKHKGSLNNLRKNLRIEHARELMGPTYRKSVVSRFEKNYLDTHIYAITYKSLPRLFKNQAFKVAETIINESHRHQFDPYFILAIISGESSFNPHAKGSVGEIGLMQIRLSTGKWLANLYRSPWEGKKTLLDPVKNIKLGVAYLAWLRSKFDNHGQLYLAAYNMGPGSVKRAVSKNIYPKDYPIHVMKRYVSFYKDMKKLHHSM